MVVQRPWICGEVQRSWHTALSRVCSDAEHAAASHTTHTREAWLHTHCVPCHTGVGGVGVEQVGEWCAAVAKLGLLVGRRKTAGRAQGVTHEKVHSRGDDSMTNGPNF